MRQADREGRRREQLVVDPNRRHQNAVDDGRASEIVDVDSRLTDTARHQRRAVLGKQGDLAEFPELEHVVFQDLILLATVEAGILEVRGEGLEQVGVGDHVAADFLGRASSDILVAADDGIVRALLQRQN